MGDPAFQEMDSGSWKVEDTSTLFLYHKYTKLSTIIGWEKNRFIIIEAHGDNGDNDDDDVGMRLFGGMAQK